jgi:cell division septal protein FtsQ
MAGMRAALAIATILFLSAIVMMMICAPRYLRRSRGASMSGSNAVSSPSAGRKAQTR